MPCLPGVLPGAKALVRVQIRHETEVPLSRKHRNCQSLRVLVAATAEPGWTVDPVSLGPMPLCRVPSITPGNPPQSQHFPESCTPDLGGWVSLPERLSCGVLPPLPPPCCPCPLLLSLRKMLPCPRNVQNTNSWLGNFPEAAVAEYQRRGGRKQQKCILVHFWSPGVWDQVSTGPVPSEFMQENLPQASQLLAGCR